MDIQSLEIKEKTLIKERKELKQKIKDATKPLQEELKVKEKELKNHRKMIKDEKRKIVLDKSLHPMERFILWMNSNGKEKLDWIMEEGPLRDTFFDAEDRYETVYVEDRLWYIFSEIGYYIDGVDNDVEMDLDKLQECKNIFDSWDKDSQNQLIAIIDDAIEQNISEMKYDW